jgi:hypothetical protein
MHSNISDVVPRDLGRQHRRHGQVVRACRHHLETDYGARSWLEAVSSPLTSRGQATQRDLAMDREEALRHYCPCARTPAERSRGACHMCCKNAMQNDLRAIEDRSRPESIVPARTNISICDSTIMLYIGRYHPSSAAASTSLPFHDFSPVSPPC